MKVRAFLQRNSGSTTMRLWYVSQEQPGLGWFHDMDFAKELREEIASAEERGSETPQWGAFQASFFGPDLQEVEALSRNYDERFLDSQLTRGTPPELPTVDDAHQSMQFASTYETP